MPRIFGLAILFLLFIKEIRAYSPLIVKNADTIQFIGKSLYLLNDKDSKLSIKDVVIAKDFVKCNDEIPYMGIGGCYWVKFQIKNVTDNNTYRLVLAQPILDSITFYYPDSSGIYQAALSGDALNYSQRKIKNQHHIFDITLPKNQTQTFYFKIKTDEQFLIPLYIGTTQLITDKLMMEDLFIGIFIGVLLVMFLYNLFLYFNIRDVFYLYYLSYLLFIGLTQLTVLGYTSKIIFPEWPGLTNQVMQISLGIASLSVLYFGFKFLHVVDHLPRLKYFKIACVIIVTIAIVFSLSDHQQIASIFLDLFAMVFSIVFLIIIILLAVKGVRSARYLAFGWVIALIGFSMFAARNIGLLPYNAFTNHTMQVGIAIEVIIFSFALADRINALKRENELKQQEIIKHLQENEQHILAAKKAELLVETLKKETLMSQFESLKAQVNPHFLFNSLNVLTELIYQNQNNAAKFVKELSEVYRYVLDCKSKEIVDLNSELKFVEAFTYLLKIRYADGLIVRNELQGSYSMAIPPLAIQLLLENAIKHNIISEKDPLTIDLFHDGDYLVVRNKLNKKFTVQQKSGIGISNLEKRYKYLTDKKVIISEESGSFIAKIPLLQFSFK